MRRGLVFATGLGIGTGLMFLLDPVQGKRRRALLRDKCIWAARKTGETAEGRARDLRNRAQGVISEMQSRFSSAPVDDAVLADRLRAKLGHVVRHPKAINVAVENGKVTLRGRTLSGEIPRLLATMNSVRGVNEVVTHLETQGEPSTHQSRQSGYEPLATSH